MANFDLAKFESEGFKQRERDVEVPELKAYFADGPAIWRVRGLTASEVARVRDSVTRARDIEGLLAKLTSGNSSDKAGAVLEIFGVGGDHPDEYVRRLSVLEIGSVEPKIRREHAVKISEVAPMVFWRITDEIYTLTGQGRVGESSASGTTPESGPALPLPPEAESEGAGSDSFSK